MTACERRLWGLPGGLLCIRLDVHTTHSFESTSDLDAEPGGDQ